MQLCSCGLVAQKKHGTTTTDGVPHCNLCRLPIEVDPSAVAEIVTSRGFSDSDPTPDSPFEPVLGKGACPCGLIKQIRHGTVLIDDREFCRACRKPVNPIPVADGSNLAEDSWRSGGSDAPGRHRCASRGDGRCIICGAEVVSSERETSLAPGPQIARDAGLGVNYCHACGARLLATDAKFCSYCGQKTPVLPSPGDVSSNLEPVIQNIDSAASFGAGEVIRETPRSGVSTEIDNLHLARRSWITGFIALPCALVPIAGFWVPLLAIIWGVKGRKAAVAVSATESLSKAKTGLTLGWISMGIHAVLMVGAGLSN